jgi:ribosomal protein S18 acetylase RimI-like enzyme
VIASRDTPRLADETDLPELSEIVRAAYAPYLERMDRPPAPLVTDMRPQIHAGRVWVVGRPIQGLICLTTVGDTLLIENLAVHPLSQSTGLGRTLMRFAEKMARQRGLDRLQLYTNEVMTENLAIYAHLGYLEVGRRIEDGYRRVFMEKDLSPP